MPLTDKGEKIKRAMANEYGSKKGESVFYASKNKGTIQGVDEDPNTSYATWPQSAQSGMTPQAELTSDPQSNATGIGVRDSMPDDMGYDVNAAWAKCFGHDCWKTMGKDAGLMSDPSSSIPIKFASNEKDDPIGVVKGGDKGIADPVIPRAPTSSARFGDSLAGIVKGKDVLGQGEHFTGPHVVDPKTYSHHGFSSASGYGPKPPKSGDAASGRGPTDKDPDQPTGFDKGGVVKGMDFLKKGMLRLGKAGSR